MVTPEEQSAIKQIETEALQAEQRGDWGEALELYERIRGRGLAQAHHLTMIGNCLIKLRRRKDASDVLVQAFELDPNYQPCIELLNKYLPGWEKRAARGQQGGIGNSAGPGGISVQSVSNYVPPPEPQAPEPSYNSAMAPPPPPSIPGSGGGGSSVSAETTQTQRTRPRAEPSAPTMQPGFASQRPAMPGQPGAPAYGYEQRPAAMGGAYAGGGSAMADENDPFAGNKVYWPYVLKDAEEEMGGKAAVKLEVDAEDEAVTGFGEELMGEAQPESKEEKPRSGYSADDF